MKKRIWIILGAVLLLGAVLFVCLGQKAPDEAAEPSLPAVEPDRPSGAGANNGDPADTAAPGPADPDGPAPGPKEPGASGSAETDPALPIDWNQVPPETETAASGTPNAPGNGNGASDSPTPPQTEPGGEPQTPAETGGQVVIPILPPDIFP